MTHEELTYAQQLAPDAYRILVTGPRTCPKPQVVRNVLSEVICMFSGPITLVHGHCPTGVDAIADQWGREQDPKLMVSVEAHPAQRHPMQDFGPWPMAGPRRNLYMTELGAHLCVAFIMPCTKETCMRQGKHGTHGTGNCISYAERAGIPVKRWYL